MEAFAGLVERHNGIFGGCWCSYFHPDRADREPGYEGNRMMKKRLVEAGQAHAALVMDGEQAIAWAEYGPPTEPAEHSPSQAVRRREGRRPGLPDHVRLRGQEVPPPGHHRFAIRGALDLIARAGGGAVEAYPHDLTDQTKKMSSSFLYNGTRRLYERLGFTYVRPKGLKNCVMSIEVPAQP